MQAARELAAGFDRAVTLRTCRPRVVVRRSLWEADPALPVDEGGGGCGLDNLRTLCIPCHQGAMSELAGRRAAARRARTEEKSASAGAIRIETKTARPPPSALSRAGRFEN